MFCNLQQTKMSLEMYTIKHTVHSFLKNVTIILKFLMHFKQEDNPKHSDIFGSLNIFFFKYHELHKTKSNQLIMPATFYSPKENIKRARNLFFSH